MLPAPDQQISLTDPDGRSMATSGRGSGVVGYNVQAAVDTEHHLIVAHEVTNVGIDRAQLARMSASRRRRSCGADTLDAVADRGYFNGEEILACDEAGITVTLPKPMTSGAKAEGRFGKQDFVYLPSEDVYRCPAGEQLTVPLHQRSRTAWTLRRYWTTRLPGLPAQEPQCTTGPGAPHHALGARACARGRAAAARCQPDAMRQRRETVEHPFGTIKARMGATHFLMKTLPKVASRDGAARARLQSDARDEHRRRQRLIAAIRAACGSLKRAACTSLVAHQTPRPASRCSSPAQAPEAPYRSNLPIERKRQLDPVFR